MKSNVSEAEEFLLILPCSEQSQQVPTFVIRNRAQGLALKVPYLWTSLCQILVLKVPQ